MNRELASRPEVLVKLLRYDPNTGELFWLPRPNDTKWTGRYAGKKALASVRHGYLVGEVFNCPMAAHRVAFTLYHGRVPNGEIDHINGDRRDNRIDNLREVDRTSNSRNMKRLPSNKSGVTGVSWSRAAHKWHARIRHDNKYLHLGYFHAFENAVEARKLAEKKYGYHPNHGRTESVLWRTEP